MPVLHICENICALYLANDDRMKKVLAALNSVKEN